MAIDTFSYCVSIGASGTNTVSVSQAQFGDGYKQIAEIGINQQAETWTLTNKSLLAESIKVRDFLLSHVAHSFYWTNPWGEKKLYRVKSDSIAPNFITGQFIELSFTFEQAFAP